MMKKLFKLFLIITLAFTITFNYVKAETGDEEPGEEVKALITSAPVVSVKGNNNTLILSWDAVENATSYVIERSTNSKKGFKKVATVSTTTYTNKKLTYGTTYYYKVTAVGPENKKTSSVYSKKVTPNKVVISSLKPGSTQVKVTWGKTSNSGYYVYRSTDGKKWTKVATIKKSKTTSYTDKKLKSNKKYYYQVQAFQKVGKKTVNGSRSAIMEVITSPAAPKFTLKSSYIDEIIFTLSKVSGAVRYEVYQAPSKNGKYEYLGDIDNSYFNGNSFSTWIYVDKPYSQQYYKVRACSELSCGSFTAANAQGQLGKTTIEVLKGENKAVTINWAYTYGADGYEIYRATSKNGKYTKIKTVKKDADLTYKDKGVKSNKTYYYKVRSYIKVGKKTYYSAYSAIRKVKTGKDAAINSACEDAKVISKLYYPSKTTLIEGLVDGYGYKYNDAKKGVEKAKINFKENALKTAKDLVNYYDIPSEEALRNELNYHGFTESEINYAISKIKIDWHSKLVSAIQNDLRWGTSRQVIIDEYTSENVGYTEEQVLSVLEELNPDFMEQALIAANRYVDDYDATVSSARTRNYLIDMKFTEEEVTYALENLEVDWVSNAVNAYEEMSNNYYSRVEIVELLTDDYYLFTEEEVTAALELLDINFNEVALSRAEYYVYGNSSYHYSAATLTDNLESDGFTSENIAYALEEIDYDFDESCLEQAREFLGHYAYYSEATITSMLQGLGFTSENISYALEELNIDFNEMALNAGRSYMFNNAYEDSTREQVRNSLRAGGYTEEQVAYAITNMGSQRWNESAIKTTARYIEHINQTENRGLSKLRAIEILPGLEYEESEINYVKNNMGSTDETYFGNQALLSAQYHLDNSIQSESSLVELLINSDLYEPNEANYAIIHGMFDFDGECVERVEETYCVENLNKTIEQVREELKTIYGFEDVNIDYAFAETNINDYVISE